MSYPVAFEEIIGSQLPVQERDAFWSSLREASPVSIRMHNLKKTNTELFQEKTGIPWCSQGYYLPDRPVFTLDPAFHAGAYYVQEASSMVLWQVVLALFDATSPPVVALDLCAAPGGKTTLLRSVLPPDSLVVANEVIQTRYPILRENMDKWGHPGVVTTSLDSQYWVEVGAIFDLVLVDAPCSGEGLFRKDDQAVGHWSMDHVQFCAARQRRILQDAASLVKTGGYLVYSTCTYNDWENIKNAQWIQEELGLEHVSLPVPDGVVTKACGYQCYPHRMEGEGFYFAVFRQTASVSGVEISEKMTGKKYQPIGRKELPIVQEWLHADWEMTLLQQEQGFFVAWPSQWSAVISHLSKYIKRIAPGVVLGELKQQDFIPNHALATSLLCSPTLPAVELSERQALQFLKRETIEGTIDAGKGWHLFRYQGLGVGWGKVLPNRINNYLPNHWRIRMQLPPVNE